MDAIISCIVPMNCNACLSCTLGCRKPCILSPVVPVDSCTHPQQAWAMLRLLSSRRLGPGRACLATTLLESTGFILLFQAQKTIWRNHHGSVIQSGRSTCCSSWRYRYLYSSWHLLQQLQSITWAAAALNSQGCLHTAIYHISRLPPLSNAGGSKSRCNGTCHFVSRSRSSSPGVLRQHDCLPKRQGST